MTKEYREKRGGSGNFKYSSSEFLSLPYCVLCQKGNKCQGICCQGPKKPPKTSTVRLNHPPPSTIPPGAEGGRACTTLTSPEKENSNRRPIAAFSPNSEIFKWSKSKSNQDNSKPNTAAAMSITGKDASKNIRKRAMPTSTLGPAYDPDRLRYFLKRCNNRSKQTCQMPKRSTPSKAPSPDKFFSLNSTFRKLLVSELPCQRKLSSVTPPTLSPIIASPSPIVPPQSKDGEQDASVCPDLCGQSCRKVREGEQVIKMLKQLTPVEKASMVAAWYTGDKEYKYDILKMMDAQMKSVNMVEGEKPIGEFIEMTGGFYQLAEVGYRLVFSKLSI